MFLPEPRGAFAGLMHRPCAGACRVQWADHVGLTGRRINMKKDASENDVMQLQPPPPGFEHINRYFDAVNQRYAAKLLAGQFFLSRSETIVTVVGTCVAACIRDRIQGLGGMNHFLEPYTTGGAQSSPGEDAMFDLVKALLNAGAQRRHLEARLFGGACILDEDCEVGTRSIAAARLFLQQADIPLIEEDVGGRDPRKIEYLPQDGRVRIKHLRDVRNDTIIERDRRFLDAYRRPVRQTGL